MKVPVIVFCRPALGVDTTVRFGLSAPPMETASLYNQARELARQVETSLGAAVYVDLPLLPRIRLCNDGDGCCSPSSPVVDPYPRLEGVALEEALASIHRGQWEDDDPAVLVRRVYPQDPNATHEQIISDNNFWRSNVQQMLGPAWGGDVLDVGCGVGRVLDLVADAQHSAAGIDISGSMLRVAEATLGKRATLHRGSGWSLPFLNESFDGVYSTLCLQHQPPLAIRERYLAEIRRVLRPGGRAGLQFKILGWGTSWWHDRPDYAGFDVSFLSAAEGIAILALYGFRVVESWITDIPSNEPTGQWWWTSLEAA